MTSLSAPSNRSFIIFGSQSLAQRLCGTENSYLEKNRCRAAVCRHPRLGRVGWARLL